MKRLTSLLAATAATISFAGPALAEAHMKAVDFDDAAVMTASVGTATFTKDGKALGTVQEATVDDSIATFVIETDEDAGYTRQSVEIKADEGTVLMGENGLTFKVSNDEMQSLMTSSVRVSETPLVVLTSS